MADTMSREQRSKLMRAVKSHGSKIETSLQKELWRRGHRYRKNYRKVVGTPDIAFVAAKVAVFCDSEFWHGHNWTSRKGDFKSNQRFWHEKIEQNIARDKLVTRELRKDGWTVLRFWGKDIEKNLRKCVGKIEKILSCKRKGRV